MIIGVLLDPKVPHPECPRYSLTDSVDTGWMQEAICWWTMEEHGEICEKSDEWWNDAHLMARQDFTETVDESLYWHQCEDGNTIRNDANLLSFTSISNILWRKIGVVLRRIAIRGRYVTQFFIIICVFTHVSSCKTENETKSENIFRNNHTNLLKNVSKVHG